MTIDLQGLVAVAEAAPSSMISIESKYIAIKLIEKHIKELKSYYLPKDSNNNNIKTTWREHFPFQDLSKEKSEILNNSSLEPDSTK